MYNPQLTTNNQQPIYVVGDMLFVIGYCMELYAQNFIMGDDDQDNDKKAEEDEEENEDDGLEEEDEEEDELEEEGDEKDSSNY